MKVWYLVLFLFTQVTIKAVSGQNPGTKAVYTIDIDHFWEAYDRIMEVTDPSEKLKLMQTLYVDRATEGLKAFMSSRNFTAERYVELIEQYPGFWKSVRENTLSVKEQVPKIEISIDRLRSVYPQIKSAAIYFTIGGLRSGGATFSNMVLVGTEIAAADSGTDASELNNWLKVLMKNQINGNLVGLNVHEFIHTQQKAPAAMLLAQSLHEGAADFIAELVTRQKNLNDYMIFGKKNEASLKRRFRSEMMRRSTANWLFNSERTENPDLGYYIGYAICKSYYDRARDKKKAVREIIELDYASRGACTTFLDSSGFYVDPNIRTQ